MQCRGTETIVSSPPTSSSRFSEGGKAAAEVAAHLVLGVAQVVNGATSHL
jgi:hypothetical protein